MTKPSLEVQRAFNAAVTALVTSDGNDTQLASEMVQGQNAAEFVAVAITTAHALVVLAAEGISGEAYPLEPAYLWKLFCMQIDLEHHEL